jgi:hypothetical protein
VLSSGHLIATLVTLACLGIGPLALRRKSLIVFLISLVRLGLVLFARLTVRFVRTALLLKRGIIVIFAADLPGNADTNTCLSQDTARESNKGEGKDCQDSHLCCLMPHFANLPSDLGSPLNDTLAQFHGKYAMPFAAKSEGRITVDGEARSNPWAWCSWEVGWPP